MRVSARTGRIINKPEVQRRDGIIPEQWKGLFRSAIVPICGVVFFNSSSVFFILCVDLVSQNKLQSGVG